MATLSFAALKTRDKVDKTAHLLGTIIPHLTNKLLHCRSSDLLRVFDIVLLNLNNTTAFPMHYVRSGISIALKYAMKILRKYTLRGNNKEKKMPQITRFNVEFLLPCFS